MQRTNIWGLATAGALLGSGCLQIIGYEEAHPGWTGSGGGGATGGHGGQGGATTSSSSTSSSGGTGGMAPTCSDGKVNGDETGMDCGGGTCPACPVGEGCKVEADCKTGPNGTASCTAGKCVFTCANGFNDCDGEVGCEADFNTKAYCGSCSISCSAYCVSGTCNDPIAITTAYSHSCAILGDGSVWCWGLNQVGELGDGTSMDKLVPTKVALPKPATAISAGGVFFGAGAYSAHTCVILDDKSLRCWGSNTEGELGMGNTSTLVGPQSPGVSNVVELSAGGGTTCVVNTSNQLYCWGYNSDGQVGTGSMTGDAVTAPTLIMSSVAHVSVGGLHTCAVKQDGNVYCWGSDSFGQVGNGAGQTSNVYAPWGPIPNIPGTSVIASGRYHTCARNAVGLFCWGHNGAGQLGIGNTMHQPAPVAVSLVGVTALELGDYHSSALVGTSLYLWGENTNGQLGDGTGVGQQAPKASALTNVAQISLAETHSCGLTTSHKMYCWGDGAHGKLGTGGTVGSSVPVEVAWP